MDIDQMVNHFTNNDPTVNSWTVISWMYKLNEEVNNVNRTRGVTDVNIRILNTDLLVQWASTWDEKHVKRSTTHVNNATTTAAITSEYPISKTEEPTSSHSATSMLQQNNTRGNILSTQPPTTTKPPICDTTCTGTEVVYALLQTTTPPFIAAVPNRR